jgi:hypothetical protein
MIYELVIEEGKEKQVINFLKQLDFVTLKTVKKSPKKALKYKAAEGHELSYFGTLPGWEMDRHVGKLVKE